MKDSYSDSYAKAGVNVTAGYETVEKIKPLAESTFIPGVLGSLGGFGGMFEISQSGINSPVLVSGADGVGTKLKYAFETGEHGTIGVDCVAMCVNDIICSGAKPLYFLDYLAMGKNLPELAAKIVSGIAVGCREAGCALIGGETAEMPGFYPDGEYDLAGFAVGIVERSKIINGSRILPGDALIGLASSGLHSNGFSLARQILHDDSVKPTTFIQELGANAGDILLTPTRIYVKPVLGLIQSYGGHIKGISHITGGGFYENIPRLLPEDIRAKIDSGSFPVPPIFEYLKRLGTLPLRDMFNTFNMGIGLVIAVSAEIKSDIMSYLRKSGEFAYDIGFCERGEKGVDIAYG